MGVTLREFLVRAEGRRIVYGKWDCCLWLADWGRVLTGVDAAAHLRGRYRTALGAERVLRREGGLVEVVGRGAALVGMKPLQTPQEGAVGVVVAQTKAGVNREVGAIFNGRRWVVLAPAGILALSCDPVAMWGLSDA